MEQLQAFDGGTCGTSDLTDVLGVCECGAPMEKAENGEVCCAETLRKFELLNGRPYGRCT